MAQKGNKAGMAEVCPSIAYVLLWFPLSSETFIFREILDLEKLGLNIRVYTMYGKALKGCSEEMRKYSGPVERMGVKAFFPIFAAFFRAFRRQPHLVWKLLRRGFFRKMRNLESQLENMWCFMAGFLLAEKCRADDVKLIHSSWANGPATAAWVASSLSGIPFAFTGRAGDIYPEDGILAEKARDALFIRTNNAANVAWLTSFCPPHQKNKVFLVYNGLTFQQNPAISRKVIAPPYHILAVGRFARTKGFPELFTAMARLKRERFPVELTLVGDGAWRRKLLRMRRDMGLEDIIHMPGFVPHDQLDRFADAQLLVVPSVVHSNGDRDGIPNVIMEALANAMPVVATDVCGISEVVRDGHTGLLAPQRNPSALACAIRKMLENGENALAMGYAGQKLVLEMFNREKNAGTLKNLYLDAIKGAGNDA